MYKNERLGHSPPAIHVPALLVNNTNHNLCPVKNLQLWINKTQHYSGNSLYFDLKSLKSLNASRISFLLCKLINEADPNTFPKAHDIRKMAVSLAWTKGVPVADIIKNSFWKNSNVFVTKYLFKVDIPRSRCVTLLN